MRFLALRAFGERTPRGAPRIVLSLFVLAMGLIWTASPVAVSAAGNCGQAGGWFGGWQSNGVGHEPEGVKASLTYRTAASCQGIGADASYSGWVMITGADRKFRYAQSGFFFDGNALGCMRHFSEWSSVNAAGNFHRKTGACTSSGEVHVPMVKYIAATGATEMWIDATKFDTMAACSCNFPRPLAMQFMGETHNINGDIPGLAGTKTNWASEQIQYFIDDTWHGTCGTVTLFKLVTLARFAADAPACNNTRSWTAQP